jgi:hypothetical protein
MKTKHTDGQWKYSGLTIYAHKVTDTQDSRKIIALIDPKRGEPSEENEANAKLISSAPDLLEALKAARKLINQERKDALTVREIIQQAIDKATK